MSDQFPSNSMRDKGTPAPPTGGKKSKEIKQITTGEVLQRKRPLGPRLWQLGSNVWRSVLGDVLIPAAKDMAVDAIRESGERAIFGESRGRLRGGRSSGGYTPYGSMHRPSGPASPPGWSSAQQPQQRDVSPRGRAMHDFGEIVLSSRGEAEEVLDQLIEIISQYQQASVADLYAMVGISSAYTDQKYGWTDLRGANAQHVRGGSYLLSLPPPRPLD